MLWKTSSKRQIDQLVSRFRDLEARNKVKEARDKVEARERELDEQLRYEVANRFCRGLVEILCNKLDKLSNLLSDLASELHRPALRYAPNAFVLFTYHHHNDNTLPDIFYEFSEHVHQLNVSTLEDITPRARTILTALDTFINGPYGDDIRLLTYLWAVRAGLGNTRSLLAHSVPGFAVASEILHELIPDPEQQALVERILPSLIEEDGVNEHIKYFAY
ncbi:uncharacterized protein EV420DRAFT_1539390 [Desarmillaria tabescens]|uniref:Uncharacterized protein n=1 Tax=Armillaria tabescens TaxID=1929756 RepID=A0AA39KG76_ARMTA|nr:uncharacterized protein EV420DRAFT_1539390 [Desarmillaria tabescens]KAK0459296.1 hypothetical protein EV420DRAFT_1539390 [Desarmillaria tabescens]